MTIKKRLSKLSSSIGPAGAFYISNPSDVFYLSGFRGTFGKIAAFKKKSYFITDSRYTGAVINSPIASNFEIVITRSLNESLGNILKKTAVIKCSKNIALQEYLALKKLGKKPLFDESVMGLRMIKDEGEVSLIKKAVSINESAILHLNSILKPGVTEDDLSAEFDYYIRKHGADSSSFSSIIAFGPNGAVPHHGTSSKKLKVNNLVLIDAGVRYKGYCSDLTRVIAFGIIKPRLMTIKNNYNLVQNAKKESLNFYKEGSLIREADLAARNYLDKYGLGGLFTHSLGHAIGIDVHEAPSINRNEKGSFKKGMVFSCEPGIYIDRNYGIRIEDDYLITENGPEKLGKLSDSLIISG
ncbi:MAG: Xaa-Pro peptidase family protein [Candidatus Goldiibacteriota bacterium]|jgi:Xaa-Pro aminopeptidase